MVELINNYIQISEELYKDVLKESDNIFYIYYPETNKMLISSVESTFFAKLHPCQSTFLRQKNAKGVRVFQIANILLDYNIDNANRKLPFTTNNNTHILTIIL